MIQSGIEQATAQLQGPASSEWIQVFCRPAGAQRLGLSRPRGLRPWLPTWAAAEPKHTAASFLGRDEPDLLIERDFQAVSVDADGQARLDDLPAGDEPRARKTIQVSHRHLIVTDF